jgi:5-methylcytosine-specific restriction endonuclease McrA
MPYKNPEKQRAYYLANRERYREACRKWRAANPEYQRDWDRAYRATGIGYAMGRANSSRYDAIRRGAVIDQDFKDALLAQLLIDSTTCATCNDIIGDLHGRMIDHRKAIFLGGIHTQSNIQILCHGCETQKSNAENSLAKKLQRGVTKSDFELVA